jgi:uroporphyrinogen-III decarboxylase
MSDLFDPRWELPELTRDDFGPYVPDLLSDAEKDAIWKADGSVHRIRVPHMLGFNNRVALLDSRIDACGLTHEQTFADATAMLRAELHYLYLTYRRYHWFCDRPTQFPDVWQAGLQLQNVCEAMFLGCPVHFPPGQVPGTTPILTDDTKRSIFDIDITRVFDRDPNRMVVRMIDELREFVKDKTFLGRPIEIAPPCVVGSDGPMTVAMNVRGPEIFFDMIDDPDYAFQLFRFLCDAALLRRKAYIERFGFDATLAWLADDSIAMLSVDQYRESVMPHHRYFYESVGQKSGHRGIHLCGDATHLFAAMKDELGVTWFDTGYPVDFGRLRKTLGPEVAIAGGVEVSLLLNGSPHQVYDRARAILQSGIAVPGRFTFREANNLPPNVPWANLSAMYAAVQRFGTY